MKKNYFLSLVVFMLLSLSGIIFIQGYWIYTSMSNIEEEFSLTIRQALSSVAEEVQERELRYYFDRFETVIDSAGSPETSEFRDVFLFYVTHFGLRFHEQLQLFEVAREFARWHHEFGQGCVELQLRVCDFFSPCS